MKLTVAVSVRLYSLFAATNPVSVKVFRVTVKVCVVDVAAKNSVLPAWDAVITHEPTIPNVTVAVVTPLDTVPTATEHTEELSLAKLTNNPELAVAVIEKTASP